MQLVDKTKKVGKGLELRTKTELTENAGKAPESSQLVHESHPEVAVATYSKKDGETLETSASQDAQENGDYEKAASKAGVKKEDLKYTSPGMVAAQAAVSEHKKNPDSKKEVLGEKAKLVKTDPSELPKSIAALHMDGDLDHGPTALKHIKLHTKHASMADSMESRMFHHRQAMDIFNHMTGKKKYEHPTHSLDKSRINPALTSNTPTHTLNGQKMKSIHTVDTKDGKIHVLEHMDGENKGKWTNAHESKIQPLHKAAKKTLNKSKDAKFERCVQDVKKKQGEDKVNPWAICHSSLKKSKELWENKMEKCSPELYKSVDLDEIRARAHRAYKARRINLHRGKDVGDKIHA